jgi:hypothetical protein
MHLQLGYYLFRGIECFYTIPKLNGDFTPSFFNFVILPSSFSNEAAVYPYSLTPLGLVGLNGQKKDS